MNLHGWTLTDDPEEPEKWIFPDVSLGAGECLIVFASGDARTEPELHANFKLSASGEYLALVAPDGAVVSAFAPSYPALAPDQSYALIGGKWGVSAQPTPGHPNTGLGATPRRSLRPRSQLFVDAIEVSVAEREPTAPQLTREVESLASPGQHRRSDTGMHEELELHQSSAVTLRHHQGERSVIVDRALYVQATEDVVQFASALPIAVVVTPGADTDEPHADRQPRIGHGPTTVHWLWWEPSVWDGRREARLREPAALAESASMHRRGRSSAAFPKKQFRLEIRHADRDDAADKKVLMAGLPQEADWVLGAPYADESLIRNALAYDLGRQMGLLAPRTAFFELFVASAGRPVDSDDYQGVYVLTETIEIGKDRVDLQELTPAMDAPPDVSGGYIWRNEVGSPSYGVRLRHFNTMEFVDPEQPTPAQYRWLSEYVGAFDATMRSKAFADPVRGYARFLDVASFVDTFIINEFCKDEDAYLRSSYFHKDRGGRINKGPLWDFNTAFGNGSDASFASVEGWCYSQTVTDRHWFHRLMEDEEFRSRVRRRFEALRAADNVLHPERVDATIDRLVAPLAEPGHDETTAALRNFAKWQTLGQETTKFQANLYRLPESEFELLRARAGSPYTRWEAHVDHVRLWSRLRLQWLQAHLQRPSRAADGE